MVWQEQCQAPVPLTAIEMTDRIESVTVKPTLNDTHAAMNLCAVPGPPLRLMSRRSDGRRFWLPVGVSG